MLDLFNCKGTLKVDGKGNLFLIHESQEEDGHLYKNLP